MIALPEFERTLSVTGSKLIVRFVAAAEKSAGGVWLPDSMKENLTTAKVLAVGPGYETAKGSRVPTGFTVGDQVVFPRHSFTPITKEEAAVYASDVIARLMTDDDGDTVIVPENDYVMVDRVEAEATLASGLILPERARRRGQSGRLVDWGPGRMREEGPRRGVRAEVAEVWGLPERTMARRPVLYWSQRSAAVQLDQSGRSIWLIKSSDVDLAEVDDAQAAQ